MARKQWLTLSEAQKKLGISEATARRMLAVGQLPGFKVRGNWKFDPKELDAFIERQKEAQLTKALDKEAAKQAEKQQRREAKQAERLRQKRERLEQQLAALSSDP